MGEVYRAEDTKLGRRVALKVLPEDLAYDEEHLERFRREARALAALDHPNIVTVHSVDEADGVHFITMGLVEGEPLSRSIPKGGMSPEDVLAIAAPLADALAAAHARGVTHRDLKPSNVMIGADGRVKVLDFGLAKLRPESSDAESSQLETEGLSEPLTGAGTLLGTVPYMSPEQVQGEELDHRTDIFSFGVMLHEMATGKRPFEGKNQPALMSSVLKDDPPSVSQVAPEHSARFGRIVKRCLNKDPSRRYQSSLDLRNELEELAEDVSSGSVLGEGAQLDVAPQKRPARGWLVGAAAMVVLAGLGYWFLGRAASTDAPPTLGSFEQLTSSPGVELYPSLSPDGRFVAYASQASGNWDIYLQRAGGENAINLTADAPGEDNHPAFSPDGESIAFWSDRDGGGLFVMGATGESVRRIADEGYHPDWSPDGRRIVYSTRDPVTSPAGSGDDSEIRIVDVVTGQDHLLVEEGSGARYPRWSPNGHRIVFWEIYSALRSVDPDGGDPVTVVEDLFVNWSPAWSAHGKWLYFASNRDGPMSLWRIGIDERTGEARGEPQSVIAGSGGEVWLPSVARNGESVVYATYRESTNIQRARLDPGGRSMGTPTWFTRGTRRKSVLDISPDGRIVYREGDRNDIVVTDLEGADRLQLTDDEYRDKWPRWSPDGERIAFHSARGSDGELMDIWSIGRDGRELEQLTFMGADGRNAIRPVWSSDGRKLAFSSGHPTGFVAFIRDLSAPWSEEDLYRVPVPDDWDFFQTHEWSPDGRHLGGIGARAEGGGGGVVLFSLEDETLDVVATSRAANSVRWMGDGRTLLWAELSTSQIRGVDLETRETWTLISVAPDRLLSIALSPDQSEIFFDRFTREADLWLARIDESPD